MIWESSKNNDSSSIFRIQNDKKESESVESEYLETEISQFSYNKQFKWDLKLDRFGFIIYWGNNSREVLGRDPEYIKGCHFPDLIEEKSRSFINHELMNSDLKTNFRTSKTFRFPLHNDFKNRNRSSAILFRIQRINDMQLQNKIESEINSSYYKISIRLSSKKGTEEMLKNYKEADDYIFKSSIM